MEQNENSVEDLQNPNTEEELTPTEELTEDPSEVEVTSELNEPTKTELAEEDTKETLITEESVQLFSNGLVRIPIAKKGKFFHPSYGNVEFTEEDFNSIKNNFSNDCLGFKPYATYGHLVDPSLTVDAELKKGSTREIQEENDVLYVLSEPTPDTLDLIQKGEYEYSSGEFIRNYIDKETGENRGTVLMRYALTNSPFIPFKDKKIEILSQNSECPQTITEFILKLSLESGIPEISQSSDISLDNMQENTIEEKNELPASDAVEVKETETKVEEVTPVAAVTAEVQAPKVEQVKEVTPAQSNAVDVKGIVKEAFAQAKELYQAQIEAVRVEAKNAIESIKAENAALKENLQSQAATVQAFSTSMSEAEKKVRYQALANQGMPASFIQRFSQLESALQTGSQVIKLSNSAGESVDKAVSEEIASLLIEALHSEPVQVQQFGQSISTVAANGLVADMQKLVEANRKAANKVAIA
jgi:hypothetical protein